MKKLIWHLIKVKFALLKAILKIKSVLVATYPDYPSFFVCNTCTRGDIKWMTRIHRFVESRIVTGDQFETCFLAGHDIEPIMLKNPRRENQMFDAIEYDAYLRGEVEL